MEKQCTTPVATGSPVIDWRNQPGAYSGDRKFSDRFVARISILIAPLVLVAASADDDMSKATDLTILRVRGNSSRIACRVRRPGYADSFPYDFTVRSERDSGALTELSKIMSGHGDLMFYGHAADETTDNISRWLLISLQNFRVHLFRQMYAEGGAAIISERKENGDGTYFHAFDVRDFLDKPSILIHSSHAIEPKAREIPF